MESENSERYFYQNEEEDSGSRRSVENTSTSSASTRSEAKDDPTNLIVNYLPVYFDKHDLRCMFEPFGEIESLIIMYNNHGNRKKSRGYGFVKFTNANDAQNAIKRLDGKKILNKTIKVSVARPGRNRKCSNLFVSRLPSKWTDRDLQSAFCSFGRIVECRVLSFGDGVSRRCGFVRFDTDEQANFALRKMRNFRPSPEDQPLQVNLSVNHSPDVRKQNYDFEKSYHEQQEVFHNFSQHDRQSNYMFPSYHDLFPRSTYEDRARFMDFLDDWPRQGYPSMYDSYPMAPPPQNGYPRAVHRPYEPAERLPQHVPTAFPPAAAPKAPKTTSANRIFVQNIPEFYDEAQVASLFQTYGNLNGVTVQRDRNGNSLKCAFVVFQSGADAKSAVEAVDGVFLSTNQVKVLSL